ncbi:MAG: DUF2076 domain-containing protein [Alphaproteobacteria bacterium]|nr:DUF2076 domain-containing protein [Alphaproteobacteria bacterium]
MRSVIVPRSCPRAWCRRPGTRPLANSGRLCRLLNHREEGSHGQDRSRNHRRILRSTEGSRGTAERREAEALIVQRAAAIPGATYYLVQAAVVSEHALIAAQTRVQELEHELSRSREGSWARFLEARHPGRPRRCLHRTAGRGRFRRTPQAGPPRRRCRERGRASLRAQCSAAGVAGGMLLGNVIGQLLAPAPAAAAESAQGADAGSSFDDDEI